MITYEEYMKNGSELNHKYYAQFVTEQSKAFILNHFKIETLVASECKYFNDLNVERSRGGAGAWIWDYCPIPYDFIRSTGMTNVDTPAVHTSIGKATARVLVEEYKQKGYTK